MRDVSHDRHPRIPSPPLVGDSMEQPTRTTMPQNGRRDSPAEKGQEMTEIILDLRKNIERANKKHGPMRSQAECYGALKLEVHEVADAMQKRNNAEVRAELLDVMTVAARWILVLDGAEESNG